MIAGHQIIDVLLEKIPELVGEEETATEGGRALERTFTWQVGGSLGLICRGCLACLTVVTLFFQLLFRRCRNFLPSSLTTRAYKEGGEQDRFV